jgi:hypothetical protein
LNNVSYRGPVQIQLPGYIDTADAGLSPDGLGNHGNIRIPLKVIVINPHNQTWGLLICNYSMVFMFVQDVYKQKAF